MEKVRQAALVAAAAIDAAGTNVVREQYVFRPVPRVVSPETEEELKRLAREKRARKHAKGLRDQARCRGGAA